MLDDDEAIAVALALTVSATHAVADTAEASMRALSKIIAMRPSRLRPQLANLARATTSAPVGENPESSQTLQSIAAAIQSRERLRFTYLDAAGLESHREVEAYRLVLRAGRLYLLAWDPDRQDWRAFRIDRLRAKTPNGRRFADRPGPAGGFEAFLVRVIESAPWHKRYRVRLAAPAKTIRRRAPISVDVASDGKQACIVTVGSDNPAAVAR